MKKEKKSNLTLPPFLKGCRLVFVGGSGQCKIECPRCKSENCYNEGWYRTGEELTSCHDCGYYKSFFFKRDDDRNFIKKDETKDITFDNLVSEEVLLENPFGIYEIDTIGGGGSGGTLETLKDYKKFISEITCRTNQDHNIKKVIISRFINGEFIREIIFPCST